MHNHQRARFLVVPLVAALLTPAGLAQEGSSVAAQPPLAAKKPHETKIHNRTLTDDYFWLREKSVKANLGAGHGGPSGRYDALRETAFTYAFILWQMGLTGGAAGSL